MKRPSWLYRFLYQVILRITTPLALLVLRVHFHGIRNIPKRGPFILCCNHRSVIDPWLLAMGFRQHLYFMAKYELFEQHSSAAAWFLRSMGAFPVHRERADMQSLRTAENILQGGDVLGIFPQGKVVFDNSPFQPKSGAVLIAARANVPIVPASIWCDGPWKPCRKVTIRIGKTLPAEIFSGAGKDRQKLRQCAKLLADTINQQLEMGHDSCR
ncbi:MAG: 1-acyl-sn-glycerol-3-phosphate acyltransferase [Oscillospiraceae bacterium]|jgi:1-acyl-sn-glycerol-3-phosphate acyltransferase|nr:1-acyl-sn-glycerol-3-phosphate acyltransferase [Oscillospiraceae bacterium]